MRGCGYRWRYLCLNIAVEFLWYFFYLFFQLSIATRALCALHKGVYWYAQVPQFTTDNVHVCGRRCVSSAIFFTGPWTKGCLAG